MLKTHVRALLIGTSFVVATPAIAATPAEAAPAEAAPETGTGIQEIVVTANRVETAAQKTAIALTVYSAQDLQQKGVTNIQALQTIDPSVNLTSSNGAAYVAVRGIASTDVTEIGDPSVPVARDGFYTNRSFSIQSSMYDVARVEVLKGPQGTLQGRNSTGGLISIITNRPAKTSGGYVNLGVGNYGAFASEMGANLLLADNVQVRASGIFDYHRGYRKVTGIYTGQAERGDDQNVASGRIQIAIQPAAGVNLWASYQHDSIIGVGDVSLNTTLGVRPDFGDAKTIANASPTTVSVLGDRIRWEASLDELPGGLRLIYAGGYDKQTWRHALDATGPTYPAFRQFLNGERPTTWNHEVRLSNAPGSAFFFQAGYFHFQETNTLSSGLLNLVMMPPFNPGGPLAALSQAGNYGIKFDYNVKTKSDAVFGQIAYAFNEQLKLSLGARYTWDKKLRTGQAFLSIPALVSPFAPPIAFPTPGNGTLSEGKATWHAGLDYQATPRNLLYVKYDRGYKPGGFNSNGSAPSVNYGPETVDTFEIGSKNRFMDNKLELNLTAYYSDYRGYQASQSTAAIGGGSGVFNVGKAKIYGAEAQVAYLFDKGGRLDFNGAYLHTRFGNNIGILDGGGTTRQIGGNRLPNAPEFAFTAGIEQAFGAFGGTLTPRIEGKYSDSFYYSVFNDADTQSRAYMTGSAYLSYKPTVGSWSLTAFVRNFTDKVVLANAARNFTGGINTYQFQPPLTFGLRGAIRF